MKNKPARKTAIVAGRGNKVSGRRQTKPSPEAVEEANPVKTGKPLTNAEKGRLQQCENTIGSGLASFVGVGKALRALPKTQIIYR